MTVTKETDAQVSELEIVLTREFDAPRELVWKTFTEAQHLEKWWGPEGFSTKVLQNDVRPGGRTKFIMIGPDGAEYPVEGKYLKVEPPYQFVTTDEFGEGFEHPEFPDLPTGIILTTTFDEVGSKTKMTMTIKHRSTKDRQTHEEMGVVGGWGSSFNCLDAYLENWSPEDTSDRDIKISRVIKAPRDLVFDLFTDVEHLSNWWGPEGFSTTTHESTFEAGGTWLFTMHGPDGTNYENKVVYDAVNRPERLMYHHEGLEDHAHIQFVSTVLFEIVDEGTKVTLWMVFETKKERDDVVRENGAIEGGKQTLARFDRLVDSVYRGAGERKLKLELLSDTEIRLTREFDAPKDLVFEAFTSAEHMKKWWGCHKLTVLECEVDFRVGGQWRIVQQDPMGQVYPFKGEYKEITRPDRLVYTFIFDVEMIRDHASIEHIDFIEQDGKTTLINTVTYDSKESRDGHLNNGMEGGAKESMNRLEELLKTLK